jgi:glycosyltransferase involved in cell wall biosynthesis
MVARVSSTGANGTRLRDEDVKVISMVARSKVCLPQASIIITNYNYGRFLRDAVESVQAQTYPHIECIIVDDASTDESEAVLAEVAQRWPEVKIIRQQSNGGQAAAFSVGFAASAGEYVVFLDADDVLLPSFVEIHIFTHLSLRLGVGFTTSDMLQATETRVVRGSWERLSNYVVSGRGARPNLLRRVDVCAPELWRLDSKLPPDFEQRLHLVDSDQLKEFLYSPTSGNCFRRDALDFFLGEGGLLDLKFHGDTYLNKGVCLLAGAVLIDMPLTIYRIHGQNGFARRPELRGTDSAEPLKAFRAEYCAWRAVVDRLIANAAMFIREIGVDRYVDALVTLQKSYAFSADFPEFESLGPYIQKNLRANAAAIEALLGAQGFQHLLHSVKYARANEIQVQRRAPRKGLRPIAELLLTLGRLSRLRCLTAAGEKFWHL